MHTKPVVVGPDSANAPCAAIRTIPAINEPAKPLNDVYRCFILSLLVRTVDATFRGCVRIGDTGQVQYQQGKTAPPTATTDDVRYDRDDRRAAKMATADRLTATQTTGRQ
jgi:hypothetical protein